MVRCSRDDASGRLLELPIWMFDRASCALIEVVAAPRVDLTALSALIALLRETERADGASSNARLSGAAMGTHNPNRGETHGRLTSVHHDPRGEPRQFDLFASASAGATRKTPEWRVLPAETRQTLNTRTAKRSTPGGDAP
jgi:hypothetical protein